ncbi:DUF4233 domain-containing protein [Rhodococcus sp. NPDC127528]|uniref:DUF4233 domain-containing protein n=1 Tax=unclassified Rhodococcus (in: high G+C Gram-positive bacteria) TaxID=192944 RepID=UPI003642E947
MSTPDQPAPEPGGFKPPATDPWKGFRGVCSGILILEAIVVLLAIPAVAKLGDGISGGAVAYILVLGGLMILGCGVQGRSWAIGFDLALQVAMIAGWLVHPVVGALGLLFAAVWVYMLYLRRDIQDRIEQGLLPGQRD